MFLNRRRKSGTKRIFSMRTNTLILSHKLSLLIDNSIQLSSVLYYHRGKKKNETNIMSFNNIYCIVILVMKYAYTYKWKNCCNF